MSRVDSRDLEVVVVEGRVEAVRCMDAFLSNECTRPRSSGDSELGVVGDEGREKRSMSSSGRGRDGRGQREQGEGRAR